MAEITNPEQQCKKTPESFSGESKIEGVDREDYRQGVILDSPEEFGEAIIVYGEGYVRGAGDTQNHDLNAIGQDHGAMAVGLVAMGSALIGSDSSSFSERLAQESISSLKSHGRFHKSHDYTFNNFQKTEITGKRVGDKYVLGLCAAYVGTEPENKLAETLKKPMALVRSSAKGRLSIVDDWWFNLNLEDAVKGLPLPKKALKNVSQWAQYLASGENRNNAPEFEFKHEGKKFTLSIGLNAEKYLRPEVGKHGSEYLQARGKSIVGGAWTTWAENGNDKCESRIVKPSLVCSVSLPGERYSRPSAVTSEEMSAVQSARDYIFNLMQQKI